MRKWTIIAFMIALYIPHLFIWLNPANFATTYDPSQPISPYYGFLYLLVGLAIIFSIVLAGMNLYQAIKMNKRVSPGDNKGHVMGTLVILKFVLLPFYVGHFICWLGIAFAASTLYTFMFWVIIPLGILYAGMVIAVSAALGISQIVFLGREEILTKKQCVIHSILQLIPFVDAISCLNIYLKTRNQLRGNLS